MSINKSTHTQIPVTKSKFNYLDIIKVNSIKITIGMRLNSILYVRGRGVGQCRDREI